MHARAVRFTQLEVWKKSHRVVLEIYKWSRSLPRDERYVLGAQLRKAAISIPANIAEGSARRRPADKGHFYTMARSSAEEVRYYFILCLDLGYVPAEAAGSLDEALDEICRMLYGMIESMEARIAGG